MARMLRSLLPDGIYHVTSRGVADCLLAKTYCSIFRDDDDRRFFLCLLQKAVERFDWRVHTFCLLGSHYHLVIECTQAQLSDGMQFLNGRYAEALPSTRGTAALDTYSESALHRG